MKTGRPGTPDFTIKKIIRDLEMGDKVANIAARYGLSPKSIRHFRLKFNVKVLRQASKTVQEEQVEIGWRELSLRSARLYCRNHNALFGIRKLHTKRGVATLMCNCIRPAVRFAPEFGRDSQQQVEEDE